MTAEAPRLCFDSNALIYLLEGVDPYHPWLDRLFRDMEERGRTVVLSVVTEAEVMIRPLRDNNRDSLALIDSTMGGSNVMVISADREIAREAARIRAGIDLALPDAIIVATAIVTECDALIGNDLDCARRVKAIPYVYLDEAVASGRSP